MRILFLFCLLSLPGFGNTPHHPQWQELNFDSISAPVPLNFDEEKIAAYKEDASFDYSESFPQETWWTKFKRYIKVQWSKFWDWLLGDYTTNGILRTFIEILPYLIIGGILIFILWLFNKLNPAAAYLENSEEGEVFLTEEEEIIRSRDIQKYIDKAVKEKKFNLAIRYQYLLILQVLARKEIIVYESSKTNEEYSREIKEKEIHSLFKNLSWIYDYTWYGNFLTDEKAYQKAEKEFAELHQLTSRER